MTGRQRVSRYGYLLCSGLFAVGILTQVFLVGLSIIGGRPGWQTHVGLGHGLGLVALLMLIFVYLGGLPSTMKRLTWVNFAVYILLADVVIFLRGSAPLIASFHPVLAVILFALAVQLPVRAWQQLRSPETAVPRREPEASSIAT